MKSNTALFIAIALFIVSMLTTCDNSQAQTTTPPSSTVVQYGDTYWALASFLCPNDDPRIIAGRLLERNGNQLIAGQTINTKGVCDA